MLPPSIIRVTFFILSLTLASIIYDICNLKYPPCYMNKFVDLLIQPDDITCGPTSTSMLLRFYGVDAKIDEVKKLTKTVWYTIDGKDFGMTAPSFIRDCLISYGFTALLKKGDLSHLKNIISSGRPSIVLVRSGEWNWHYIVVVGYGNGFIYFANPSSGEVEGLSESEFKRAWNWSGDLRGNKRSWWVAFWLSSLEIYPCSYVYINGNI